MSTVTFRWKNGLELLYFSFKENNNLNIDTVTCCITGYFLTYKNGISLEWNALNTGTRAYTMYTYIFLSKYSLLLSLGPIIYSIQLKNFLILLSEAGRISFRKSWQVGGCELSEHIYEVGVFCCLFPENCQHLSCIVLCPVHWKKSKCAAFENQVIFYMKTRGKRVAPRKQNKNGNVVSENILIMILSDGFLLN